MQQEISPVKKTAIIVSGVIAIFFGCLCWLTLFAVAFYDVNAGFAPFVFAPNAIAYIIFIILFPKPAFQAPKKLRTLRTFVTISSLLLYAALFFVFGGGGGISDSEENYM